MAGIYSQGGSAGHRYAGWLSEVEAKNFQFGGKVFNGSPSAIYVGSKMVWSYWLKHATWEAIVGAFGQRDGKAVINATNAYLNQLAASDRDKAQQIADLMNSSDVYACGFGELFWKYTPCEYINTNGANAVQISIAQSGNIMEYEVMKTASGTGEAGCAGVPGSAEIYFMNGKIYDWKQVSLIEPASGSNAPDNTKMTLKFSINLTGTFTIGQYNPGYYVWYGNIYNAHLRTPQNADVIWLRPCYRKTDGEIGLFDVINREFKTNIGSGTFLKGPDV